MKTHLVIPDAHANPEYNNERAKLLGSLLLDLKPDILINLGDGADLCCLSSYDKGKRSFQGRTYQADINSFRDFQEKLWQPIKKSKRKLPSSYYFIGNHEQRIDRALDLSPELTGTISYRDLDLDKYYDEVIYYQGNTPGTKEINGITYAHYLVSGIMGRASSGINPATTLLTSNFSSCTVGHSHILDYAVRTKSNGEKIMGLTAGCFIDYHCDWAGEVNKLWWSGVIIKHNVENGCYDPEFVSMQRLKNLYG